MAILGIDLGTSNSLVGAVQSGFPLLFADDQGKRLQPSVVGLPKRGEDAVVAYKALRSRAVDRMNTVQSIKRLMGRRWGEVGIEEWSHWQQRGGESELCRIEAQGRQWSPEEISAFTLRHLVEIAQQRMEEKPTQAVITVPAYFNHSQREATRKAGELAGLEVVRMINEPTAAAMAYRSDRRGAELVLVFDWGGGTLDVSILQLKEGIYEVLATAGDTALGGDDLDWRMAVRILKESGLPLSIEALSPVSLAVLLEETKRIKEQLSTQETGQINLTFFEEEHHLAVTVSRKLLEEELVPLWERMQRCVRRVLLDADVGLERLDEVLLVGGSTRIPQLRNLLSEEVQKELNTSQHPDEAVALGAVIQAGIIEGSLQNQLLLDVLPLSLGVETVGGLMNVLLPRNTTIPAKSGELFTNAVSGQTKMQVKVLQGEREMAKDNWELGKIDVPFQAANRGKARVGVEFSVDENGLLTILARDLSTGKDTKLIIDQAAVNVDDLEVQEMVAASVDNAYADFNQRVWAESALKANELLQSLELALTQLQLSSEELDEIHAAKMQVALLLEQQEGNGQALKNAVKNLDEVTEPLAAKIIQQLLELPS